MLVDADKVGVVEGAGLRGEHGLEHELLGKSLKDVEVDHLGLRALFAQHGLEEEVEGVREIIGSKVVSFITKQILSINDKTIEVNIMFYHPNDDETKKVYDIEGMTEEFNYKFIFYIWINTYYNTTHCFTKQKRINSVF